MKLYQARTIHTLEADQPCTHIAIDDDGRIAAIGGNELQQQYGPADQTFADQVMVPGFVEGHAHAMEGVIWKLPYVGFYGRYHPDGDYVEGCDSVAALLARLAQLDRQMPAGEAIFAWGYDAIYFGDDKPMKEQLDQVSTERPIIVHHSNLHLITVNSKALALAGIDGNTDVDGIYQNAQGEPNGELAELAAMFLVYNAVGNPVFGGMNDAEGLVRYGRSGRRAGVTTAADLYNNLEPETVATMQSVVNDAAFPMRLVSTLGVMHSSAQEAVDRALQLRNECSDKLRLGAVKIVTDGSIQGFSARVRQPYVNGVENGVWNAPPPAMEQMIIACNAKDIPVHVHVNGDQASEFALQAFAKAAESHAFTVPHVLQHAQMMDTAQLEQAKDLDLHVNFFANHTFYWGDQHRDETVGKDIAQRMNPAREALDLGLNVAIHSDAPVSPLGPLHVMWAAVNRVTASGALLGPNQRISAVEGLQAITLGPARTLGMDSEIGSLAVGKRADITVLDLDPLAIDPMSIKDVIVVATLLDGKVTS